MRFPPALGVAVAVASVSFAGPLFRLADSPPLVASLWRLALAVLILLPFTSSAWPAWRAYGWREWRITAFAGVALGLHFALWVSSLFYTTIAASTALVTLQAIFVAIGGAWLGDKLSKRAWLGILIAVAGAIVITATDGNLAPDGKRALLGDGLALLGGLGSAAYMLIGRRLRARRDLVEYVTPVYAIAAVTLLFLVLAFRQPVAPAGTQNFVFFVALAAIPMLGGHTVANWTMKYLPAHIVATWILLEPIGAALLAWPILGEIPHPLVAVGGAVVLVGAALTIPRKILATEPAG